jgi:hypothetical protein
MIGLLQVSYYGKVVLYWHYFPELTNNVQNLPANGIQVPLIKNKKQLIELHIKGITSHKPQKYRNLILSRGPFGHFKTRCDSYSD